MSFGAEKVEFKKILVALAGPPLMGKSTSASAIEARSNLTHFDVDVTRWQVFPRTPRLVPDYRERLAMIASYAHNHIKAGEQLLEGRPAMVNATYSSKLYHDMLKELASGTESMLTVFLLDAPDEQIEQRISERIRLGNPSVITSVGMAKELRAKYQPIEGASLIKVNTGLPLEENIDQVFEALNDHRI